MNFNDSNAMWSWQYMDVVSEEDGGDEQVSPLWPTHGALEFSHVSLVYQSWLPPALKDVSFSIAPHEHVRFFSQRLYNTMYVYLQQ